PTRVPPFERGREMELSFELLDARYRERLAEGDERTIMRALQNLALVDPALALERSEAGVFEADWRRDWTVGYVADALLFESPEESLAVSHLRERGLGRAQSILNAAERLAPELELEQLALIRAEARGIASPQYQLVVLGRLADRLLDLGRRDAAIAILDEGRVIADALPALEWAGFARCNFAEVLGRVDLPAARAMIAQLRDKGDERRHLGNLAHRIAASDPVAAEALLAELSREDSNTPWKSTRWAPRVAYCMAQVDTERARRIAEVYDPTGYSLGMVALALVDVEPALTLELLDAAFLRFEALGESGSDWEDRLVAGSAALLPIAAELDPKGLRGHIARVLAMRPIKARGHFGGKASVWSEDATLAFYLAAWDPQLARNILEPVLEAVSKLGETEGRYDLDAVWAAAAVVDPERATTLAREMGGRAATKVGVVLAIPPADRTKYVQGEIMGLWVVGKEDI
ncbi:MAG: hypothetical protein KUG67_03135, partial [Proteobacteria bacterium]|nr:hypothetical protein [Pseudomonadota bacterium]